METTIMGYIISPIIVVSILFSIIPIYAERGRTLRREAVAEQEACPRLLCSASGCQSGIWMQGTDHYVQTRQEPATAERCFTALYHEARALRVPEQNLELRGTCLVLVDMSYSLNSLKGAYTGNHIGDYYSGS